MTKQKRVKIEIYTRGTFDFVDYMLNFGKCADLEREFERLMDKQWHLYATCTIPEDDILKLKALPSKYVRTKVLF